MYEAVVKALERQLGELDKSYQRQLAFLQATLKNARAEMEAEHSDKQQPQNGDVSVAIRKDCWKGMPITFAVQAYLSQCDGPVSFDSLLAGLKTGGVDLGKDPGRYERNLRSTLGNTRNRFAYNKRKNTVKLLES